MKKILLLSFCMITASALMGQFKFGAGISLELDENRIALGARGHNIFSDDYAGQISANYYFTNNNQSAFTVDVDVHYYGFKIGEVGGFIIAPFGGLNITNTKTSVGAISASDTELGINLGIHANVPITNTMELYIEPKFIVSGLDGFVVSAGVYF